LSLIFSICALSNAPSNDRAQSAGRRGDHLGLGVRLRRPAMPKAWRRSGQPATVIGLYSPPPPCLPGGHPERRSASCDRATPGERRTPRRLPRRVRGARGGGAFRRLRARPKGLEPAQRNRHPTPNPRTSVADFGVRFTHPRLPEGARLAPACLMVRGDDATAGHSSRCCHVALERLPGYHGRLRPPFQALRSGHLTVAAPARWLPASHANLTTCGNQPAPSTVGRFGHQNPRAPLH
jgi:hypothetical protein